MSFLKRQPPDGGQAAVNVAWAMDWLARIWGVGALLLFAAVAAAGNMPQSSYIGPWEERFQALLLGAVGLGLLAAWRWDGVGGAVMLMGGAGFAALASTQYHQTASLVASFAFLAPAALFLFSWQRRQSAAALLAMIVALTALFAGGWYVADRVHDHYFGPTHPASMLEAAPVDLVEWAWAGATTDTSVTVNARLSGESDSVRLAVGQGAGLADAAHSEYAEANHGNNRTVSMTVSGLSPDTRYHYAVEVDGRLDTGRRGSFRTFPAGPASFTLAFSGDARLSSNGRVFDEIRELDPLLFVHTGDFHYANITRDDLGHFRRAYSVTLESPAQSALYRGTSVAYVWDDHDFGGNDSDSTSASRPAAQAAYREAVPHYDLPGGDKAGPIYQALTIGRVRFLLTDTRSQRTPRGEADGPEKTMLGAEQKEWLKRELLAAKGRYPLIVWVNPAPWIDSAGRGKDTWGGYANERKEIADFIADNEITGLAMLAGDAHMLAIDDGSNSDYSSERGAGFPVFHAAALDRRGSRKGGPYSEGAYRGSGQFGVMTVEDSGGSEVSVTWSGRNWEGTELVSYAFAVRARPAGILRYLRMSEGD